MSIDSLRCSNYDDFSIKMSSIEKVLEAETVASTTLNKVLEFIEINQDIFINVKKAAICLHSIATKVRHLAGNEQLIKKLSHYVKQLIPSEPQETKDFLQLIRRTVVDPVERLRALVDWIDFMGIPLAQLQLTENEFIGLVTSLEYPDLTNFDFQSLNWKIVTISLLTGNLKFKTTDVKFLSTLAKFCAQQDIERTTKYIQNFAISDEQARIEIAKFCAQKDGEGTAASIQNFAIEDEKIRIQIAKLCVQNHAQGIASHIQNFALGELARIEIAKLCAEQDGRGTSEYIQDFAISSELVRVEIARICANQNGGGTVSYIGNFAIADEGSRALIAKICAQKNGGWTSANIQNFAIVNKRELVEIAKLCANQDGGATALSIKNFAIEDEEALIEIAKICAQRSGRWTASLIQNFAISNELVRMEIAKICAQQDGKATALGIGNFQIANPHSLYQLFLYCVEKDPKSLFHMNKISSLPEEFMKISPLIQILKNEELNEPKRKELFEEIRRLIKIVPVSIGNQKIILEMCNRIQALLPEVQNAAGLWLVSSLLFMKEMKPDNIEWLLERGIWTELGLLKDPILRVSLSFDLHALSAESDRAKLWNDFLPNVRGTEGQRGLMLLAIPFSNLQQEGIDVIKLLAVANHLSAFQWKKRSSLRNVYQVKNLLHTMHSLVSSAELTAEQKRHAFEKIFFDPLKNTMIDNERQILDNVISAKGLLQLKDTQWPHAKENLTVLFRSSLEILIPMPQFKGDVLAKYEEIFAKCRNPTGLLTYAAGLKTLGEPALLSCLGEYMVWVMNATFKDKRYDATLNPHLVKVLEGNPDLLLKWKEEIQCDLHTLISEDKKEESFDSQQWLHTKLLIDKHLGGEKLDYLIQYIEAQSAEFRKEIFSLVLKKIASLEEKLKDFATSSAFDPVLINLNLQKACITFAKEGKTSDRKLLIHHLEEINQSLTYHNTCEFAMDVKGLLENLKKSERNSHEDLQVVFTDDPIDLLLCGTDISGSCQRLDGEPKLNRGLLGYLIDGKNRLLAIKKGKKIVARCMLKLLWDGKRPVIYRERFYPDQIPAAHKQALNILATQVSQKLNAPLTCEEGSAPYNNILQALGGPAPYEYCDGADGVQKEGRYTIHAKILN